MSKWQKLLERIRCNPKTVRFDEVKKILESMGYKGKKPKSGTSHWTFRKNGYMPITIPERNPYVKETYVKIVINMLNWEDGE